MVVGTVLVLRGPFHMDPKWRNDNQQSAPIGISLTSGHVLHIT